RFDRYAEQLESVRWLRNVADPEISIVIIAHEVRPDCVRALEALRREQGCRFELVYVLHGSGAADPAKVSPLVDVLVTLRENTGAYFARNVGAVFAAGPILLFLDDDAIPADGCAAAHLREFNEYDVIAVRGAILPKTENPLNELA